MTSDYKLTFNVDSAQNWARAYEVYYRYSRYVQEEAPWLSEKNYTGKHLYNSNKNLWDTAYQYFTQQVTEWSLTDIAKFLCDKALSNGFWNDKRFLQRYLSAEALDLTVKELKRTEAKEKNKENLVKKLKRSILAFLRYTVQHSSEHPKKVFWEAVKNNKLPELMMAGIVNVEFLMFVPDMEKVLKKVYAGKETSQEYQFLRIIFINRQCELYDEVATVKHQMTRRYDDILDLCESEFHRLYAGLKGID